MKREAFLRDLRREARTRGVDFSIFVDQGRGSHYRVRFGDRMTIVQSGELTPLMVRRIRRQLGLEEGHE